MGGGYTPPMGTYPTPIAPTAPMPIGGGGGAPPIPGGGGGGGGTFAPPIPGGGGGTKPPIPGGGGGGGAKPPGAPIPIPIPIPPGCAPIPIGGGPGGPPIPIPIPMAMAIPMAGAPPAGAAFFSPATFTFILRPSTCAPFIDATARCAASRSANLTNPNPRAEPSGLRTTRALSISPLLSNSARSRPSSMCSASEPTYTFEGSNGRSPRAAPNPAPIPPAPPTAPAIPGTLSTPSSERKL